MAIADALEGRSRLFLDTAPVVYDVEHHPSYFDTVRAVFDPIQAT